MPGRQFNAGTYRHGFNGKENDNEVKGVGNSLDFGSRIYDSRVNRFLSLDPLTRGYPNISPYLTSFDNPIYNIDEGGESGSSFLEYLMKMILGYNRSYHNDKEAQDDVDLNSAVVHTKNDLKETKNNLDAYLWNWVLGMSFVENAKQGNYKTTLFLCVFDVYGGKIVGGFFKGTSRLVINELFKSPINVPKVFESAAVKSFKFIQGANGAKTAIIRQGMARIEKIAATLNNPETFVPTERAAEQWLELLNKANGKQLSDKEVEGALIYTENQNWIQKIKDAGYSILDIGNHNSMKPSTFYNMEKKAVYGTTN